jgi:hypothetical protein
MLFGEADMAYKYLNVITHNFSKGMEEYHKNGINGLPGMRSKPGTSQMQKKIANI